MSSDAPATPQTSKTEFMRWLDDNQGRGTMLQKHTDQYLKNTRNRHTFGQWVRVKHAADFNEAYENFWLKSSDLFDSVYQTK